VVLVVEDDGPARGLVAEYLRDCGYVTLAASSAGEAMTVLSGGPGVNLPRGMEGLGLVRWVRMHRPEMLVVLTSGAYAADFKVAHESIAKPYTLSRFKECCARLLTTRLYLSFERLLRGQARAGSGGGP
jgi:CheY-like chemotaxis protein